MSSFTYIEGILLFALIMSTTPSVGCNGNTIASAQYDAVQIGWTQNQVTVTIDISDEIYGTGTGFISLPSLFVINYLPLKYVLIMVRIVRLNVEKNFYETDFLDSLHIVFIEHALY